MDLLPNYPVVEDYYRMTAEWTVVLPSKFNRRTEDGDLVLWHPGFTAWIAVWGNDKNRTAQERLALVKKEQSPLAFDAKARQHGATLYYTYRLDEDAKDKRAPALYCYALSAASQVEMAVYFDTESEASAAESLCLSLRYEPQKP
jgi:hypothetical protein